MSFSPEENLRYARHFSLPSVGKVGQQKLKDARVLVIGTGGLGCPIVLYLAAAGTGHIGLMDFDVVSLSNLQRQILFTTDALAKPKAPEAKARLEALNPLLDIRAIQERLTSVNARAVIRDYDLIVDGTDRFEARYLINDACFLEKKPLIAGALSQFDAQLSVFNYQNGPCYRCLYPEAPTEDEVPSCSEAGVLGVLPGTMGTLMAMEVLKIIIGIGTPLSGTLLTYDALETRFQKLKITRRKECVLCGEQPSLLEVSGAGSLAQSQFQVEVQAQAPETLALLKMSPESYRWLDVRSAVEFASPKFRLPQVIHIPLPELEERLDELPTDIPLVVICQSGIRSRKAIEVLREAGFENLHHFEGGLNRYFA